MNDNSSFIEDKMTPVRAAINPKKITTSRKWSKARPLSWLRR